MSEEGKTVEKCRGTEPDVQGREGKLERRSLKTATLCLRPELFSLSYTGHIFPGVGVNSTPVA